MKRGIILLSLLLVTIGCQKEESDLKNEETNNKNIARIEAATADKHEIRFAVISDTHALYDIVKEELAALNRRNDLDFVIHTGDMCNLGFADELEKTRQLMATLHVPSVCVIGNHDCFFSGTKFYSKIFGEPNFAFKAGKVHFICLNTYGDGPNHSTGTPNFEFLQAQLADTIGTNKTVVAMHGHPKSDIFDNTKADAFEAAIRQFPGLQFCIHGHWHMVQVANIFKDGVLYYECASADKRSYLLFTINDAGYKYECVNF